MRLVCQTPVRKLYNLRMCTQDADEEARYSAVSRGGGKDLGSSELDSKNDDTFGSGSSKEGSKPWSGAANSVAAITGR